MPVVADAASILAGNYDPADYIHDIVISGDTKTIRYDFSDIHGGFFLWDSYTQKSYVIVDNFTYDLNDNDNTYGYSVQYFPFGDAFDPTSSNLAQSAHGCVYLGDISPNSAIAYEFSFDFGLSWDNSSGDPFTLGVHIYHYLDYYDSNGNYLETVQLSYELRKYDIDRVDDALFIDDIVNFVGTFPAKAGYARPRIRFYCGTASGSTGSYDVVLSAQASHTALSVDINTVLENSNQMQVIQGKLDDLQSSIGSVGDKIDGTNDRLDQIITGGEAGDSLGAAGDQLEDSSGAVSDKADSVTDDIGSVGDFESGVMDDINDTFGQIDVASGVGKFNTSLAFISNYVQLIFKGVEDWEVAITLPLFLGLFFGICQHVGGITNMRARQAREARNDELHQARLEKIQKGGNK